MDVGQYSSMSLYKVFFCWFGLHCDIMISKYLIGYLKQLRVDIMGGEKSVQKQGTNGPPKHGQRVKFIAAMRVKDSQQTIFDTKHPHPGVIGQNQINVVIESLLLTMKEGEKSTFALSQEEILAIDKSGTHGQQSIQLTLELVSIEDYVLNNQYLSIQEQEKKAAALKTEGNDLLKEKKYPEAILKYLEGYRLVEYNTTSTGLELRNSLLLNLALAYSNNKQYQLSLEQCQRILREDPLHLKALYRKASALRYLGQFDRANREARRVLDRIPQNKEFLGLLKEIKEHQQANKKKEKQLYGKMFGS